MDLSEVDKSDPYWADQVMALPSGDFMLVKDINAALSGSSFYYIGGIGEGKVSVNGIEKADWAYYFSVFHNTEEFGLPHGRGWLDELPWTIQFLSQMKYVRRLIENDNASKAGQRKGSQAGSINPNAFEG